MRIFRIRQRGLQLVVIPLMPVEMPIDPARIRFVVIVARSEQAMDVERGYTFERKQDRMRGDEPVLTELIRPLRGALHGIEKRNIDLVRFATAIR